MTPDMHADMAVSFCRAAARAAERVDIRKTSDNYLSHEIYLHTMKAFEWTGPETICENCKHFINRTTHWTGLCEIVRERRHDNNTCNVELPG
jgi:hypothetical protein